MPEKLRSRWGGRYRVKDISPYGAVELEHELSKSTFKLNGHQAMSSCVGLLPAPDVTWNESEYGFFNQRALRGNTPLFHPFLMWAGQHRHPNVKAY
ncbi:hypothetical protein PIB30_069388 [Stylosanthes scabra]|uniref:Uncharacterized protein n=1 Tax=Stylosanthes scabra TaxID=79078 RepID=A0ABU6ZLX5_9FABA|nr:hypothetical protein [Stylosanthes scabra]